MCEGCWGQGWPDFNGLLVSPGLSAGNYGEERQISSSGLPNEGDGPTPSGEGSSATGGTNQVWSRAQTLGLGSVGKALATGSEHCNFHGLVETLFWGVKGGTQHGGSINACVHAHKHTVSLFLLPSLTQNPPTAGRRATAITTLPWQRHISHLSQNEDTLSCNRIFILLFNTSILIVSLGACRTLPPDWVKELQLALLSASD